MYLPPHQFKTSHNKNDHEFNLVDGGMAANNPVTILKSILDLKICSNKSITLQYFLIKTSLYIGISC